MQDSKNLIKAIALLDIRAMEKESGRVERVIENLVFIRVSPIQADDVCINEDGAKVDIQPGVLFESSEGERLEYKEIERLYSGSLEIPMFAAVVEENGFKAIQSITVHLTREIIKN